MDRQLIIAATNLPSRTETKSTHESWQVSTQRELQVLTSVGKTAEDMLCKFNPSRQVDCSKNPRSCYFGIAPTLGELNTIYGEGTDIMWLVPQIRAVSEYTSAKKIGGENATELARIIAASYAYLKITELMLFFFRFRRGDYEGFYGSVEPMAITRSIKIFLQDRAAAYDKKIGEEEQKKVNANREGAVTREEYLRMIKEGIVKPYKPDNHEKD